MAGHSHWATIKRKKAKVDAQRGQVFTKIIKEITVVARDGGGDPAGNARLRLLIDKARAANMPQDNITRAIKKGTGELEGVNYEAVTYEGYGPEGMAIMIEVLTDNKNRTVSDLRHILTKHGGKLAETGSVGWMFEHKGLIAVKANGLSEDDLLEKLIDYAIEEISQDDSEFTIQCAMEDLESVRKGVEAAGLTVESADVAWVAKDLIGLSSDDVSQKAYKLLEALHDHDDVQNVFTNMK